MEGNPENENEIMLKRQLLSINRRIVRYEIRFDNLHLIVSFIIRVTLDRNIVKTNIPHFSQLKFCVFLVRKLLEKNILRIIYIFSCILRRACSDCTLPKGDINMYWTECNFLCVYIIGMMLLPAGSYFMVPSNNNLILNKMARSVCFLVESAVSTVTTLLW